MKATVSNSLSFIRITPAIALKHPSYRGPVAHAIAALDHLAQKYKIKQNRQRGKAGHA